MCSRYTLTISQEHHRETLRRPLLHRAGEFEPTFNEPATWHTKKTGPRKGRLIASFQFSVTLGDVCCCHDINAAAMAAMTITTMIKLRMRSS
jgi:hypothetical protein